MDKIMSHLNGKVLLYQELLECTTKQRQIIENLNITLEKEEDILPFFSEYFERWNKITQDIEAADSTESILDDSESQQYVSNLMAAINENVVYIQSELQTKTNNTGSDLRGVRTQQKVLNAYYNLNSKDQIALYFDAKK